MGVRNILVSYYALRSSSDPPTFPDDVHVFLDSGAYSAWNSGKPVDVREYGKWVLKYGDRFDVYANLDVIGDAKGSARNLAILEGMKLHPLPVFHEGAPFAVFDALADRYDYIALGLTHMRRGRGRRVRGGLERIYAWTARCFATARENKVRVHGFAMTMPWLIKPFPFYSVDSTSWLSDQLYAIAQVYAKGDLIKWKGYMNRTYGPWGKVDGKARGRMSVQQYIELERHVNEFHERTGIGRYWE